MSTMHKLMVIMSGGLSCKDVDERLDDYVDGTLPFFTRLRMTMHFFMCAACRGYVKTYRKTIDLAKSSIKGPDHQGADESVDEALVQDILKNSAAARDAD